MKMFDALKKRWDILMFDAELFILQIVRMHKVVEIKGSFAVISQQCPTASF